MKGTPTAAAAHIAEWLVEQALATTTVADAFDGFVRRLREAGLAVDRAHVAYTTLHPLHRGSGATWTTEAGLETEAYGYDRDQQGAGWYVSPIHYAVKNRAPRLRRRLTGDAAMLDFPVLEDFAARGLTDYLLLCCPFESFYAPIDIEDGSDEGSGLAVSFATARATGFSDEELETIDWLLKPFAAVVKMADQRQVAVNLAECYIGHEAGPRVLGGAIKRGDFATTSAVTFMADLRRSTELSMTLPRERFIATINQFLDCAAGAVEAEGGEPLTFIGDGVLAIFPIASFGQRGARQAAFAAAQRACRALDALNAERAAAGEPELGWGVALHAGDLEYGNIGSRTRHAWSVVGSVVNETARLEGTTKETGERIVASRAFVDGVSGEEWRPLGSFQLKGVPDAFDVFGPPAMARAPHVKEAV